MHRFKERVAIISGGAEGLGRGIAARIASEGGSVILLDINKDLLRKTVHEFSQEGYNVDGYVVNIAEEEALKNIFQNVMTKYGRIDVMVNAAGVIGVTNTPIADFPVEEFDRVCEINLRGSFLMTKCAIKAMQPAGYGRILLIASIAGKEGNPNMVGYSASKAGVIGLVKAVGKEYATAGITVNGLAPAVIGTSMNANTSPEQLAYMTAKIPMNRIGKVEEVASIASWIVSEEAGFNTGFVFDLSGGRATY